MAETEQTPQKRDRDEKAHDGSAGAELNGSKRQMPYTNIMSLLDDEVEEVELSHDLLAIFTALQQELSSSKFPPAAAAEAENDVSGHQVPGGGDGDEGLKLAVMRHLLEASDDELGIPNRSTDDDNLLIKSGNDFNDDGLLWELEDEAANYYTVLQSQCFPGVRNEK